jgi:hypothetical protein
MLARSDQGQFDSPFSGETETRMAEAHLPASRVSAAKHAGVTSVSESKIILLTECLYSIGPDMGLNPRQII